MNAPTSSAEAADGLPGNSVVEVAEDVDFEDFVAGRSQALLRAAYLLTGDVTQAEDLLQTALAKSWRHWKRVSRTGNGEAYVRRVLYTTYAAWWRRRWRGETPTEHLPELEPDHRDGCATADERATLMRVLADLPRGQRAVIVLRYFEDRTESETAELLSCSVGTVKSQTARALTRLRSSPTIAALVQEES